MAGKKRKLPRIGCDESEGIGEYFLEEPLMPIRDVAMVLGIGRTRVVQLEQRALKKLRQLFFDGGINDRESVEMAAEAWFEAIQSPINNDGPELYAPLHGWLKIEKICSINDGSEAVDDVVRSYQFLKRMHEALVRPPVIVSTDRGTYSPFRVEAAAVHKGAMYARCWPKSSNGFSIPDFASWTVTAIVESEFDRDDRGDFDIPVLICLVVTNRKRKPHS